MNDPCSTGFQPLYSIVLWYFKLPSYELSDPAPNCTASSGFQAVPSESVQMHHNYPKQRIQFSF